MYVSAAPSITLKAAVAVCTAPLKPANGLVQERDNLGIQGTRLKPKPQNPKTGAGS